VVRTGDEVQISPATPFESGTLVETQLFYGGATGEAMLLETDDEWGVPVTYTSSEPFHSRDWFPFP